MNAVAEAIMKIASPRIARIVERLRKKEQAAKKLELTIKDLKATVIEFIGDPGDLVYQDRLLASLLEYPQQRVDSKRFKEEHPELYEQLSVVSQVRRLVLK